MLVEYGRFFSGFGYKLNVYEFLLFKIVWDMGYGVRKFLFDISVVGGFRLGISNYY